MSGKRLLYLDSHRLSAYRWQGGKLNPEGVFEATADGFAQFADYLRTNVRSPFQLLANVTEEGHQVETIPYLQGKDRETLIQRKISQIFFGAPLATSLSLGYEKSKRKNERLLHSALTNQPYFQPWLDALAAAEVPFAGLYTVSQLGGLLLKRLTKLPERCLLVTLQDHSLRESFIVNGVPLFSRMAPLADSSIAGMTAAMAAEAGKLQQYLVGQRQIGRNDVLPVFVLAHPQAIEAAAAACLDTAGLNFTILDTQAAAKRLGLRVALEDSHSEPLFLHLLAIAPPRNQYLAGEYRHDHLLHRVKGWLLGGGIAALAAAVVFAAGNLLAAYSHRQDSAELAIEEAQLSRRYQEISATFPQLGVSNDVLRRVASRHREIERIHRQPAAAYLAISRALGQTPAVEVASIDWSLASRDPITTANTGNGIALGKADTLLAASDEITIVRGSIRLERNSQPRQVLATFEHFVRQLQVDPEARVTVLQQPFDTESGRSLKGGTLEDENPQPRNFAIQIARRLPT